MEVKLEVRYTLFRKGNFYKGNLHTHSTESDGEKTPTELKALYKSQGYHFLAITDHNKYGIYSEMNESNFLMIPGIEIDCRHSPTDLDHVVGIGHPMENHFAHGELVRGLLGSDAQTLVSYLRERGNEAIYAHPFWSYAPIERVAALRGILGMEIFNYSCEQEWMSGNSAYYYEHVWNQNRSGWCFSSDDAHGHVPDYCGGYITVKCEELTFDALFEAIRAGSFTASHARMGQEAPRVLDFIVEDGVAKLWCSESEKVCIIGARNRYRATHASNGEGVTYAEYELPDDVISVRAICVDENRNVTWTQPIEL